MILNEWIKKKEKKKTLDFGILWSEREGEREVLENCPTIVFFFFFFYEFFA